MPIKQLRIPLFAIAALIAVAALPAQDKGGKLPIESDWAGASPTLYNKGDQTFSISLGVIQPLFYMKADGNTVDMKSYLGGAGSLSYSYFFTPHFAIGGEFGGMFSSTLGGNMLFMMPFGVKATYQFVLSPFEFPITLMVGGASQGVHQHKLFRPHRETGRRRLLALQSRLVIRPERCLLVGAAVDQLDGDNDVRQFLGTHFDGAISLLSSART